MSNINKSLMGFMYNGAALALASAAWKGNVNTIIGFNSAGTGYITFKPTSNFNSLTQLVQDGVYIVDAKTVGFDITGATLVAGSGSSSGGGSDTFSLTAGTADPLVTEFQAVTHTAKGALSGGTFTAGAGVLEVQVNGGGYGTLAAANTAIAAAGLPYTTQARITRTSTSTAVTAAFTITY